MVLRTLFIWHGHCSNGNSEHCSLSALEEIDTVGFARSGIAVRLAAQFVQTTQTSVHHRPHPTAPALTAMAAPSPSSTLPRSTMSCHGQQCGCTRSAS